MKIELKKKESPTGEIEYETQHGKLSNPPVDILESEDQVEEVGKRFKRRAIKLDDKTKQDLERQLDIIIEDWMDARSGLEQKLREWNDLLEGVTPQSDFPWVGASNVHIPLPKIKAREIAATINRSTMRPTPFLMTRYSGPESQYHESKNFTKDLENFLEDKIKNDTNIHETLKSTPVPIYRDGTVPVQIIWETNYEMVTDWKLYDIPDEFQKDYPDADSAGIESSEYNRILTLLGRGGKYEVEYEYMVATYDGPKAYMVPLIDFVHWPVFVSSIRDMSCHGKRVWYTDYQLKDKVRCKLFDKDDVDTVLGYHGEVREDSWTYSRDNIEGINRNGSRDRAQEYQIFELVYTCSLTDEDKRNDIQRKYLIYYHYLSKKVLRVEHYPIRKGKPSYFVLRFITRDGRFLGISLVDDISDLSSEVDTIHRQRINSRTITHVPSFKAKFTAKSVFDPSRREFRFRPGVTFYMADVNDVMQFDIRPVDLSGSVDDEMLLFQLIDMTTGSSSGLSGAANPIDPRAPARKQQEMLRQSSNRIDDYVSNLTPVFEDIGQYIIDLYYQFAPDRITYYVKSDDGHIVQKEMERSKLFNPNVKFKVNGTSVFMNPEQEYQRAQEVYTMVGQSPITAQNPRIIRNALDRVLMAGRINNPEDFLPSAQEMPQAITSESELERQAKEANNKEKLAARLADSAAKREHELKVEREVADLEQRNAMTQAILNVATQQPQVPVDIPPVPVGPNGAA